MIAPVSLLLLCAYASAELLHTTVRTQRETERIYKECPLTGYKLEGMRWTVCKKSTDVTIGCATPDGKQLRFGERYVDKYAEWVCEEEDDQVILRPTSCVVKGKILPIGEIMKIKDFAYQCVYRPGDAIGVDITGCVDPYGEIVDIGQHFRKGDFLYQCSREDKQVAIVGTHCYCPENEMAFSIGEKWVAGSATYECVRSGKRSIKRIISGCADGMTQIEVGEYIKKGGVVYECQDDDGIPMPVDIGCHVVEQNTLKEKIVLYGQSWTESYKPAFSHEFLCTDAGRIITGCIYETSTGSEVYLPIGHAAPVDKNKVFICKHLDDQSTLSRVMSLPDSTEFETFVASMDLKTV